MPLPSPNVVTLAKSYAAQIASGKTASQARDYISTKFGHFHGRIINQAIREAQKAMRTGEELKTLRMSEKLSAALEGQRRPSARVGVRVDVEIVGQGGRHVKRSVYLDMSWDDTRADVGNLVKIFVDSLANSVKIRGGWHYEWDFSGPTRWPAHYP
jgi:hypothetical protein